MLHADTKSDEKGCRFRNDTERLEKLFGMYTTMTQKSKARA